MRLSKISKLIMAGVAVCMMAACSSDDSSEPDNGKKPDDRNANGMFDPVQAFEVSRSQASMLEHQCDLSLKMLNALSAENPGENICISPTSIQICLGMLADGMSGESLTNTLAAYGAKDLDEFDQFNRRLLEQLPGLNPNGVEFNSHQGFWGNNRYEFNPAYLRAIESRYDAKTSLMDFNTNDACEEINSWIEGNTNGLIKKFLSAEDVNPSTNFVLANVIYFNGKWTYAFDKKKNSERVFHNQDGCNAKVTMMSMDGYAMYHGGENCQVVALPYGNGSYEMDVILPSQGVDLSAFAALLDGDKLSAMLGAMSKQAVSLTLPKFDTEYKTLIDNALAKCGIVLKPEDMREGISKSAAAMLVQHGTRLVVDENGTEAAAATAAISLGSSGFDAQKAVNMTVDRPFIYIVRETSSGAILFLAQTAGF